eukprot:TRINITY_DN15981_c0_g1_i1.p1 TRINITY_DN15981_c0_g1~~TRINITY_DN15981_c0_g1_i1.p1  ORF type:complete len:642 (+),score=168.24 TRINITY_DN15981_c0_g1_i1:99-2024(+)
MPSTSDFDRPGAPPELRSRLTYLLQQRRLNGRGALARARIRALDQWARRLYCAQVLQGHGGCVNTIRWTQDGTRLLSGSDDRCVKVWALGGCCAKAHIVATLHTQHSHNIFDAQLRPYHEDRIVTTGADGCVGVIHLKDCGASLLHSPDTGISSKLSFQPGQGDVFLAAISESGRNTSGVRLFDLRQQPPCGATTVVFSPRDAHAFAIGIDDPVLRVCDLRKCSHSPSTQAATVGSARAYSAADLMRPEHFSRNVSMRMGQLHEGGDMGISGLAWSQCGRRIAANFRGAGENASVCLFDVTEGNYKPTSISAVQAGLKLSRDDRHADPEAAEHANLEIDTGSRVRAYFGRRNHETISKEVCFLHGDTHIATGSDCGHVFLWDVETGTLRRRFAADRCIVNCVAPHPELPLFASSGIDPDVKIWDVGEDWAPAVAGSLDADDEDDMEARAGESGAPLHRRMRTAAPAVDMESARERLRKAAEKKAEGNAKVKRQEWQDAVRCYSEALEELHFRPPSEAVRGERGALRCACWLNSAHCLLQQGKHRDAADMCSQVIRRDPACVKGYFRRATALLALHDFDSALKDCAKAVELDPGNGEVQRLRQRIADARQQHRQREQARFRRMFGGGGDEGDPGPGAAGAAR